MILKLLKQLGEHKLWHFKTPAAVKTREAA